MYTAFVFNYIFAWIAVLVSVFLLSKYLLRKSVQRTQGEKRQSLAKVNKSWRYPHIILGFGLIGVGLVHGVYSSVGVLSLNVGTITWVITILFGFTWLFKNSLRARWLQFHRVLAVFFMIALIWHIVDLGGVNVFRILSEIRDRPSYEAVIEDAPDAQKKAEEGLGKTDNVLPPDNKDKKGSPSEKNEKELPYYFSFEGLALTDGIYIAEDAGYSPGLKLEVTIQNNLVKRIKILSHYEVDSKYYKDAMEKVPAAILAQQTLDVDMVSGSSLTSVGIIKAVRKAVLESMKK